ncbi:hypothetical protein J31TS4_41340 [Paenibacillus sp. J31TS4]|uniref:twin-arginine translocase TatA/TatE family subunit n=1 Tax=Paenibacillus sp. J31TS4 TaxID=2807195 RepID=UPI001B20C08A|nr:twin-arginine translocase TatA/TatE family subunit [Paenibacillus sp. J31TS4]GIP40854.1 hypothetical protein J31TS4_41340 [Paenibacillus sp. J31TS4]
MLSIGLPGLILIVLVVLLLFGPSRLPRLGRSIGDTLHELKHATRDLREDGEPEQASGSTNETKRSRP